MFKLLILVGVLGAVGLVGYRWWQSNTGSPTGGYHGAAERRYQRAYRICYRITKRHSGAAAGSALRLVRISARYRTPEIAGGHGSSRAAARPRRAPMTTTARRSVVTAGPCQGCLRAAGSWS